MYKTVTFDTLKGLSLLGHADHVRYLIFSTVSFLPVCTPDQTGSVACNVTFVADLFLY